MNDFQNADMDRRRENAMAKVWDAINDHGGTTLLSTGITADDARLAKAVVDAGVRMLEPNHPAIALARGLHGVKDMHNAEYVRHELDLVEIDRVVQGVRAVAGPDVFITVGIPGGFTELQPVDLTQNITSTTLPVPVPTGSTRTRPASRTSKRGSPSRTVTASPSTRTSRTRTTGTPLASKRQRPMRSPPCAPQNGGAWAST